MKSVKQIVAMFAVVSLMAGCASAPRHAEFRPIPVGSSLTIEAPESMRQPTNVESTGEAAGRGAAQHALTGALRQLQDAIIETQRLVAAAKPDDPARARTPAGRRRRHPREPAGRT